MKYLLILPVLVLAGCSSTQQAATPRSIMFAGVSDYSIEETTLKAQVHCQQFGRDAEFVADETPDGRAAFNCVDR